jgi:shikimate kinase
VKLHIVLIGLPGAGKTTVGEAVASDLAAVFEDLDAEIERREGRLVAEIFASAGEARFRKLERDAMVYALAQRAHVIAAGGGWAAQPGNLDAVGDGALVLYLEVTPQVAAERTATSDGRPLLGADRVAALIRLRGEREAWYRRAHASVPTDGRSVEDVASDVSKLARSRGGW